MHESKLELMDFNRRNRAASRFAEKALDDYLLARFGIQHGLSSGFEMSTQGIEKLLKSYLLFRDPHLSGSAEKLYKALLSRSKRLGRRTEFGHDVEAALSMAADLGLACSDDLGRRLTRINSYYARRYPDCGGPSSLDSGEVDDVDEAVFEIWDSFHEINQDYYYVCGISTPVYATLSRSLRRISYVPHDFLILSGRNLAYAKRKQFLETGITERFFLWHGEHTGNQPPCQVR